jgi:hypothetical protein
MWDIEIDILSNLKNSNVDVFWEPKSRTFFSPVSKYGCGRFAHKFGAPFYMAVEVRNAFRLAVELNNL